MVRGRGWKLRGPLGELLFGRGLGDGVGGEDDGFAHVPGDVDDELHGGSGGELDVDGLDVREEAQVECAALGNFPRAVAALGGDAQGKQDGLLAFAQGGFDFVHAGAIGEQRVGADFHGVRGGFLREQAQAGAGDDGAEDDGAAVGESHGRR